MQQTNWKKWLSNFLLKIVNRLAQTQNTNAPKIRKENFLHTDLHIPIWIIVGVIYFSLLGILVFSTEPTLNNCFVFGILIASMMFFGVYFIKKFEPQVLKCDDSVAFIAFILIAYLFFR